MIACPQISIKKTVRKSSHRQGRQGVDAEHEWLKTAYVKICSTLSTKTQTDMITWYYYFPSQQWIVSKRWYLIWVSAQSLSRVWLFAAPRTVACQAPLSKGFPGKNTRVGCRFPLQGMLVKVHWNSHSYIADGSVKWCGLSQNAFGNTYEE